MMISAKQLLRGKPIKVDGIGTLLPPTINDIFELYNSSDEIDKYSMYISILRITYEQFLNVAQMQDIYNTLPDNSKFKNSLFNLLIIKDDIRQLLLECLSFFIAENVSFNNKKLCFEVIKDDEIIGWINSENFEEVRFNLLRLNCIAAKIQKPIKFKNERAREIYMKCIKGKEELEARKAKKDTAKNSLENLVSYVATKSNRYDFFNIWDLTIYQFSEVFQRLNLYNQLDTYAKRWSTWGEDDFDFTTWYENINILNNGG